jgi:hypothetical protein
MSMLLACRVCRLLSTLRARNPLLRIEVDRFLHGRPSCRYPLCCHGHGGKLPPHLPSLHFVVYELANLYIYVNHQNLRV